MWAENISSHCRKFYGTVLLYNKPFLVGLETCLSPLQSHFGETLASGVTTTVPNPQGSVLSVALHAVFAEVSQVTYFDRKRYSQFPAGIYISILSRSAKMGMSTIGCEH